ncbi:unnamed protein product [Linum trigynum]|uniref:Uncharacterized protein n=1 Tax=Linum trigynum TaxID=586398 RepID=A0AAV2EB96_9ROSI
MVFAFRQVWRHNLVSELADLETAIHLFPILSIDVQHPHFNKDAIKPTSLPQQACLYLVSYLVNRTQMLQLGITAADGEGNIGGTWQFNLRYSVWEAAVATKEEEHTSAIIDFGTDRGDIEWERLESEGIDPRQFAGLFTGLLGRAKQQQQQIEWITYKGLYDVAYLVKLVTKDGQLPQTGKEFFRVVGRVFGAVVDVKCLAGHSPGLANTTAFRREELAKELGVRRRGKAHQAGSNSLLTNLFFTKMKRRFWKKKLSVDQESHKGFLWGINCRVCPVPEKISGNVGGVVVEHGDNCRCAGCSFPEQPLFRCDHRLSCSCRCRSCGSRLVPEQLFSRYRGYHPAICCDGNCAGRLPVRARRFVVYQPPVILMRRDFIVPCC